MDAGQVTRATNSHKTSPRVDFRKVSETVTRVNGALPTPPSYSEFEFFIASSDNKESKRKERQEKECKADAFVDPAVKQQNSRVPLAVLRQQAMERIQKKKQMEIEAKTLEQQRKESEEMQKIQQEVVKKKEELFKNKEKQRTLAGEMKKQQSSVDNFRKKTLLVRYGLAPWRRLVSLNHCHERAAQDFHRHQLINRYFSKFFAYALSLKTERKRKEFRQMSLAENHYRRGLIKKMMYKWKLYRKLLKAKAKAVTGNFSR